MVVSGLEPKVAKTEDGVMILLFPLLGVRGEDVAVLLFLSESIKVRAEDLLAVALGGVLSGELGVDLVILRERALEVLAGRRPDVRGAGGENSVLRRSWWEAVRVRTKKV